MASISRHILVVAVAAASVLISACGSSNSGGEELVSIKTHMDLDFRLDPNDGPEHVFSIDTELNLDRDGRGTYDSGEEVREFEASPEQVGEVDRAFAALDMDRLAEEFDADTDDVGSFTVTYDGETTEIGADVIDDGTGGSKGDAQFLAATLLLGELSDPEESPAEAMLERDRKRLTGCFEAKDFPSCLTN
jgi:hypothetical protein